MTPREIAIAIAAEMEYCDIQAAHEEGEKLIQQAINEKLEEAAQIIEQLGLSFDKYPIKDILEDAGYRYADKIRALKEPQE